MPMWAKRSKNILKELLLTDKEEALSLIERRKFSLNERSKEIIQKRRKIERVRTE